MRRLTRLRRISQSCGLIFGLFGAFGIGMKHIIFPGLHCHACPFSVTICPIGLLQHKTIFGVIPYFLLGMIGAYGLFAGRAFCGWFCPFGTVNDLLARRKVRINRALACSKYIILLLVAAGAWYYADTLFCRVCPAAFLSASLPYFFMGMVPVGRLFLFRMVVLGGVIIGMVFVARLWCRYLCPMGAVFSVFNRISLFHFSLNKQRCTACEVCKDSCVMGLSPQKEIDCADCIKCGVCVDHCPRNAIKLKFSPRQAK